MRTTRFAVQRRTERQLAFMNGAATMLGIVIAAFLLAYVALEWLGPSAF